VEPGEHDDQRPELADLERGHLAVTSARPAVAPARCGRLATIFAEVLLLDQSAMAANARNDLDKRQCLTHWAMKAL
jgi:hypothetical protein